MALNNEHSKSEDGSWHLAGYLVWSPWDYSVTQWVLMWRQLKGLPAVSMSNSGCNPIICHIMAIKDAPSRCTVRGNSVPIPEAVCCAEPKWDNNGLHEWQGSSLSGRHWYALVHRCKTTQQSTRPNGRPWTLAIDHDFCINGLVPYF